jgi:flagellar motor switch protein FliN
MIPAALLARLPRVPWPDADLVRLRARLVRYLEGPLPALEGPLGAGCTLEPAPDRAIGQAAAWWRVSGGALVGLPAASLDALHIFHGRPPLASGPDDLLARLAVDRPAAFSRGEPAPAPSPAPERTLACWLRTPDRHLEIVYRLPDDPGNLELPFRSLALDFSFPCRLSLGFLSVSSLAGARRGEMIFPGWPTKDSAFLGRHDLWLPVRFEGGRWVVDGGWFMKPSAPDHFPLDISVEVGRIRLRGSDLATLTRGTVIPLGGSLGGQVDLVCDNRLLARAELVVVGGELGLRILSDMPMFDDPAPNTLETAGELSRGDA